MTSIAPCLSVRSDTILVDDMMSLIASLQASSMDCAQKRIRSYVLAPDFLDLFVHLW